VNKGRTRLGFIKLDSGCVSIGEGDLDRLCGHGKDRARRGGAGGVRWSDVRSWHAVWELLGKKYGQGNAAQGAAVFEDSRAKLQRLTDRALVALEGSTISWSWPPRTRGWCRPPERRRRI